MAKKQSVRSARNGWFMAGLDGFDEIQYAGKKQVSRSYATSYQAPWWQHTRSKVAGVGARRIFLFHFAALDILEAPARPAPGATQ